MSARFGANATSYLSRTTDLPGATPLTVCWRTQLVTDRNAAGMLWTLINSGLNTYKDVRLLTDGTTPRLGTNAANTSASSAIDRIFFIVFSVLSPPPHFHRGIGPKAARLEGR
jgi:hypothetical protein